MHIKKENNNHKKKIWIIIILIILIAIAGGVAYYFHMNNKANPFAIYNVYQSETKKAGTIKHLKKHEKGQYYQSIYYPVFEDQILKDEIDAYINNINTSDDLQNNQIIYVDYDVENIFDHYISLVFHKKIYNEAGVAITQSDEYYNYDMKKKTMMTIRDVLRRDYMDKLKTEAKKAGISEQMIKMDNLHKFRLDDTKITIMMNDKKVELSYQDHEEYIRLADKNIPSLYQKDPIIPATQKVDPNKPMIAITFDDGPHPYNTKRIMDEFDKYNGKATFFMLGKNALENTNVIADIYKRGFELGNHSWDHSMRIAASIDNPMNADEVRDEIYKTQDVIFEAAGFDPSYFRPPYGALNDTVRNISTLDFAMWNIDSEDWSSKNPEIITNMVTSNIHNGAVILLHDIHDTTYLAVQKFLPILAEKGYQFVTLDTLMQYKKDILLSSNSVLIAPSNS